MIRLILANFELVKCCLLYFSQVNNYNQMKAGSLFYLPGKNYRWPVKTVPLREFPARSLWRVSLSLILLRNCHCFRIFYFILYIPTKSFKVKNWTKFMIRGSNKFLQLSLSMAQFVWFLNRTSFVLFHAWVTQTITHGIELDHGPNGSFLTWSLRILNFCYNEYR